LLAAPSKIAARRLRLRSAVTPGSAKASVARLPKDSVVFPMVVLQMMDSMQHQAMVSGERRAMKVSRGQAQPARSPGRWAAQKPARVEVRPAQSREERAPAPRLGLVPTQRAPSQAV
jgi:hypothetical protein